MPSITKKLFYAIATLSVSLCTDLDAVQFEDIGFKVGWNHSTIYIPNRSFDYGSRNTLSFGGTVAIGFSERVGLQIELLSVTNGYNNTRASHQLDYIQIPLLTKVVLKRGEKLIIEALVGPAISKKNDQRLLEKYYTSEYGIFFSEYDKAIIGGIDLSFRSWVGQIVLSPRYYWGLTGHASLGVTNRSFSLLVGWAVGVFQ
jgi:hypothetical protein